MENLEALQRALEFPWEKWSIFLHPAQRQLVEGDYSGPVRIAGSAGTGKTVVALHRAVFLARRHPDARVLLVTFSDTLANALRNKLRCLINGEPRLAERLEVHALNAIGQRLYTAQFGPAKIVSTPEVQQLLQKAAAEVEGHNFSLRLLQTEWEQVVDAWQLKTWDGYRDVLRLGRKTRLSEGQRQVLWSVFTKVRTKLEEREWITRADLFGRLAARFGETQRPPFDFTVVDEAQDVSVAQLRFFSALGGGSANGLFFTGDLGQRIFQPPFSWKALGIEIRGRSHILRINYRTSHQILMQADRLLGPEVTDVDGNVEDRRGTISVFNGPQPVIEMPDSPEREIKTVAEWLQARSSEGIAPHEIGIFVRSSAELDRAIAAVKRAGLPHAMLDERVAPSSGLVAVSTMHLAKGLEFRAIAVMACDDEVMPLQARIETVADESDLEEVYTTERHLLYVACTRARDFLLVSGVEPASEFLEDLQ
ncbi:MAG: UvrD-helicase domain-containing protein [bacterium]